MDGPAAREPAAQPPGDAVTVAYVHSDECAYSWHHSMVEMIGFDMAREGRIIRGGYIAMRCGATGLVEARNDTVKEFLASRDADWLLWLDTDMGFPADTCERLLAAADPVERPIVGALCFSQRESEPDGMGGWHCRAVPTIFDWMKLANGQQGFAVRWDYPRDTVTRCEGTGSACVLVHRSVFERVAEKYGRKWYDMAPNPTTGQLIGEDLSFCARAGALGVPVHVHTGVQASHMKRVWLGEGEYFAQAAAARPPAVPAATEETAVLVPVLGRPQNAAPFMESLQKAGAPLARVYAVADATDVETSTAWLEAGAVVVSYNGETPGTFAQKVNYGYARTDEPWLFLVGDDVRFHPGWLDQAQHAARDGARVVGTNDLHNPRVTSGEHATHLLVRRAYADETGASWDGPKVVCHEGYGHWFVDDEVVTAAKQRGTWAMAVHSQVEHLHPLFGGAPDDETYRLGQSFQERDRDLFEARLAQHAGGPGVIIPDIPSAVTREEATALAALAAGCKVLELGAYQGFTTVVLASVAEHVWSVDWHKGDEHSGTYDSEAAYRANLAVHGVAGRVTACCGRFEDEVPRLAAAGVIADGAFIDGQHDEASVRADLALALTVVRPGGWIAWHDYGRGEATGHPGFAVTGVADEFGVDGRAGHLAWGTVPDA
jgi:GT2 family glycosyltransferase/predicted O-methyltransferase YrrM